MKQWSVWRGGGSGRPQRRDERTGQVRAVDQKTPDRSQILRETAQQRHTREHDAGRSQRGPARRSKQPGGRTRLAACENLQQAIRDFSDSRIPRMAFQWLSNDLQMTFK